MNVDIPQLVSELQTGHHGRPKKIIDLNYLQEAFSSSHLIKLVDLASLLDVHQNTLHSYLKQHRIECRYTSMSNEVLDCLVKEFKKQCPDSGLWYFISFLRNQGICMQYSRVMQSFHRVDCLGQVLHDHCMKRR
ncbi:hypothetical protein ID866_12996 [Astraeus odoratus]|nr:hypothetical protein ID866_12996 [Astraeus odoratus]